MSVCLSFLTPSTDCCSTTFRILALSKGEYFAITATNSTFSVSACCSVSRIIFSPTPIVRYLGWITMRLVCLVLVDFLHCHSWQYETSSIAGSLQLRQINFVFTKISPNPRILCRRLEVVEQSIFHCSTTSKYERELKEEEYKNICASSST